MATDADWIFDDVDAALGAPGTTVSRVRQGVDVVAACRSLEPDLVVIDLQIGNMGGMAATMAVRHEQGMDRLPDCAILMLLDRAPDVFLAQRCDADGWLVKPLDAFRLRRAATALLDGGAWFEGLPDTPGPEAATDDTHDTNEDAADDETVGGDVTDAESSVPAG